MRMPGRTTAAIEILSDVIGKNRPVSVAMQDWARSNRYAGSGDRAAIGNLVYDVLRSRASLAHRMGGDEVRGLVLAALKTGWVGDIDGVAELCTDQYGPGQLSAAEREALDAPPEIAQPWIAGNYPEWLQPSLERVFGDRAGDQGIALSNRAPVDLRVNTLKSEKAKVAKALKKHNPAETPLSPIGLRLPVPRGAGRNPNVEADPAHARGWFEVQDAGSQVASLMIGARAGMQVADICAGAGGKTLAIAAMMDNKGQLYSHDADKHRLRPIFDRLKRAGVRNAQVIAADERHRLQDLEDRLDLAVVDAPCSGSGAWRRRPDAKWRFTPQLLEQRLIDQRIVLESAARLVRPGGRLVYITCSLLPEENADQVDSFIDRHDAFECVPYTEVWREAIGSTPPASADGSQRDLLLTPHDHDTDGFFIAVLCRHS